MNGIFLRTNSPDFREAVAWLLVDSFKMASEYVDGILKESFDIFFAHLKDDLISFIEPIYVDKVFRDSYYSYYASKSSNISKNCIRISLFEDDAHCINSGVIKYDQYDYLKQHYCGFVVIRPTMPNIIGRNAISPRIVKDNGFLVCKTSFYSTAGGFRFKVEAFPAASQDSETMTCAETTVWSMMEYFGNRYPEYSPLLPSTIISILKQSSIERQLPSNGLTESNLSYIAKCCGFGSQLYHRDFFPDFYKILSCYIESGIPVMVALSNQQYINEAIKAGKKPSELDAFIGHAVMCIGHEKVTADHIDNTASQDLGGVVTLMDFDAIDKKFVFIDDNFPPYVMDKLSKPTDRYLAFPNGAQGWDKCLIDHFVAPLYKKVYLEPTVAKEYLKELICSQFLSQVHGKEVSLRLFLCSTRSYRDFVNRATMSIEMKRMVDSLILPRFIWVAELSDRERLKNGLATGLILLDATEFNTEYHNALIISFVDGMVLFKQGGSLQTATIVMNSFEIYNNLK